MSKGRLRCAALMLLLCVSSPAFAAGAGQEGSQGEIGAWSSHKRWEAGFGADVARGRRPEPIDAVAEAEVFEAITKLEQKRYADGIAQLQAVARKYPDTDYERVANLWEGVGEAKRGRYGEARALFRKVATGNPSWTQKKLASRWSKASRRMEFFAERKRSAWRQCGSRALAACFRVLGSPEDAERVAQVEPANEHGFSIQELVELAAQHGRQVWPLRVDVQRLPQLTPPLVALVGLRTTGPHFIAVTSIKEGEVSYLNIDGRKETVSAQDFAFDFSGLVISFHEGDLGLGAVLAAADAAEIRGGHWMDLIFEGKPCDDGVGGGPEEECCDCTNGDGNGDCDDVSDDPNAGDNSTSTDFFTFSTGPGGGQAGGSFGPVGGGGGNRSGGGSSAGSGPGGIFRGGLGAGPRAVAVTEKVGPGLPKTESCSFGTPRIKVSFCDLDLRLYFKPVSYPTGVGPSIDPRVVYNFEDTASGDFGNGCHWTYGASFSEEEQSGDVTVTWPSGLVSLYTYDEQTETYDPPVGRRDVLTKNEDGSFKLWHFDTRRIFVFDPDGRLSHMTDPWDKGVGLMRNAGGVLTKVTDASGRETSVLVDDANRITRMTMPDSSYASYYYDGSSALTRVVDTAGCGYSFYYDEDQYLTKLATPTGDYLFTYQTYDDTEVCLSKLTNPQGENRYYVHGGGVPTMKVQVGEGSQLVERRCNCDETGRLYVCESVDLAYVVTERDAEGRLTKSYRVGLLPGTYGGEAFEYDDRGNRTRANAIGYVTSFFYDGSDRLTKEIDRAGNPVVYFYDDHDAVSKVVLPDSSSRSYFYDGDGRLTRTTDEEGNHVDYEHDTYGNRTKVSSSEGAVTAYTYNSTNRALSVTDAEGRTTSFIYDAAGRITRTTYPDQSYTSAGYGCCGLNWREDEEGNRTSFYYDNEHRVTKIVYPDGSYIRYMMNAIGQVTKVVDQGGEEYEYLWGWYGRVTRVVRPDDTPVDYYYSVLDLRLTKVVDTSGLETFYNLDWDLMVSQGTVDPTPVPPGSGDEVVASYSYDAMARMTRTVAPNGGVTSYNYDSRGRLTKVTDPAAKTASHFYDDTGIRTRTVGPLGEVASYAYDHDGRLTRVTFDDSSTESYYYDKVGNRTRMADREGHLVTLMYDARDRLTKLIDNDNHATSYVYDKAGGRTRVQDPNGNATVFTLDSMRRLTKAIDDLSSETVFMYDKLSRRTKVTDAEGHATSFRYDGLSRLTKVIDAEGRGVSYFYDAGDNRTRLADARGNATSFMYDTMGRLTKLIYPNNDEEVYFYNAASQLSKKVDPNEDSVQYFYDVVGRLTKLDAK